ncbi:MAG: hypothetical protein MJZ68_07790 [archaeon]|nr:hypothetical protein [archaeon]
MNYSIIRLDNYLDLAGRTGFYCNVSEYVCSKDPDVEIYLKEKALHHTNHDVSKTFLAVDEHLTIYGYYTLAIKCLAAPEPTPGAEVSRTFYHNLNAHDGVVQAFLIGQLSRADYSPKGLGAELLKEALKDLNTHRADLGCNAVRVDCHENMLGYYRDKGFRLMKKDPTTGLCHMVALLKQCL